VREKTSYKGNNKEGGFATLQRKLISSQMWLIFIHVYNPTHQNRDFRLASVPSKSSFKSHQTAIERILSYWPGLGLKYKNSRLWRRVVWQISRPTNVSGETDISKTLLTLPNYLLVKFQHKLSKATALSLVPFKFRDGSFSDVIVSDIFVTCNWVVTRWQCTFTHK